MTDPGPVPPWLPPDPLAGFELQVLVDRHVYAPGEAVRITVSATHHGPEPVEHHYPGWQRYHLSIRDPYHRSVADDVLERPAAGPAIDRWLPGQLLLLPTYWGQTVGALVPAWAGQPPGPRAEPGRYRVRVSWLGRVPGAPGELPDAWSPWFELT